MKKVLCLIMVVALAMVWGCSKHNPEDVAKAYVQKQLNIDSPVKLNTSNLAYEVLEKDDNKAIVKVSGTIEFNGNIMLVKENKKWVIAGKTDATTEPAIAH